MWGCEDSGKKRKVEFCQRDSVLRKVCRRTKESINISKSPKLSRKSRGPDSETDEAFWASVISNVVQGKMG